MPRADAASRRTAHSASRACAVNTKADIRFDVLGADWLPDWVKENLLEQARDSLPLLPQRCLRASLTARCFVLSQEKNRMNSEGELVVNSSRHRTQKCVWPPRFPVCWPPDSHAVTGSRQNYEDAVEKLQEMIDTAAKPPTGPSDETIKKVKTLYVCAAQRQRASFAWGLTL